MGKTADCTQSLFLSLTSDVISLPSQFLPSKFLPIRPVCSVRHFGRRKCCASKNIEAQNLGGIQFKSYEVRSELNFTA